MAKAQSDAERQKIKEEERALRARERDAAALTNSNDEASKVVAAVDAVQTELEGAERAVAQLTATFDAASAAVADAARPRRAIGTVDLLLGDLQAQLKQLDDQARTAAAAGQQVRVHANTFNDKRCVSWWLSTRTPLDCAISSLDSINDCSDWRRA
jgi:chromosome segregation ATPase